MIFHDDFFLPYTYAQFKFWNNEILSTDLIITSLEAYFEKKS